MNENKALYLNLGLHLSLLFVITALQGGLWYRLFSGFPSPFFWILFLTYISLYRTKKDSYILGALGLFVIMHFSIAPHGLAFLLAIFSMFILSYLKNHIFWPGPTYYLTAVAVCISFHTIFYYIFSWIFEETSLAQIRWLYFFLQIFLTTLISPFFFFLYQFTDRVSGIEQYSSLEESI